MTLNSCLYLTQLEEYDPLRISNWLKSNPNREVVEIKKKLIRTPKIKLLHLIALVFFFLPPEKSVILGLKILHPLDSFLKYLIALFAKLKLVLFHPHLMVIAITGSWGKTTTKDILYQIVNTKYKTVKTLENYNTLLGISQAIIKLPLNTDILIAEIGAYHPGDIAVVCQIIKPKVGIITAIGPMHLERFGTLENILKTKMELAQSLPQNGLLLLPHSINPKPFNLQVKEIIGFIKSEQIYPTIAKYLNISQIPADISSPQHRLQTIQNGSVTIIDDSYNSNPAGFELALDKLKNIHSPNKILVTPGMIELGPLQSSENTRLAKLAGTICQHIIIVGQTNRDALLAGLKNTSAHVHPVSHLSDTETLLPTITIPNTVVLFENDLGDQYL